MKSILCMFLSAGLAAGAVCGSLAPNPITRKLDCVGTGGTAASGATSYAADMASSATWTVTGATHGLATADLSVFQRIDNGTEYEEIGRDRLQINKTTYTVVVTFTVAQAGRILILKAGATLLTQASATLDFPNITAGTCATELTFTLTGSLTGRPVMPGWPALDAGVIGVMRISAADTVAVKLCNVSGSDVNPASSTYYASF